MANEQENRLPMSLFNQLALINMDSNNTVKLKRDGTPSKLVKRSKIWEIFTIVPDDPGKAICKECQGVISRGGGTGRSQCTTNLWKHLQNRHRDVFQEVCKFKEVVHRTSQEDKKFKIDLPDAFYERPDSSKVWELFAVNVAEPTLAKCLECDAEIIRQAEDVGTDSLWYHIMAEHPATYSRCVSEAIENVVLSSKGKRSSVWNEFTQHPLDFCKVICNTCDTIVSRGTSKERLNTTNMRRHLMGSLHQNALHSKGLYRGEDCKQEQGSVLSELKQRSLQAINEVILNGTVDRMSKRYRQHNGGVDSVVSAAAPQLNNTDAVIKDRQVDLIHTGLLSSALYQQQKNGCCCDFSIFVRYKSPAPMNVQSKTATENEGGESFYSMIDCTAEFKIHRCVAMIASEKLRVAIESGSDRLTLIDINKDAIPAFIEIVYTGKLNGISDLRKAQLQEIYDLAELLSTSSVMEYLKRLHPRISFKGAIERQTPVPAHYSPENQEDDTSRYSSSTCITPATVSELSTDNSESCRAKSPLIGTDNPESCAKSQDVGHSPTEPNSVPKVNKRKNYMPVSNGNIRKKCRPDKSEDEVAGKAVTPSKPSSPRSNLTLSHGFKSVDDQTQLGDIKRDVEPDLSNHPEHMYSQVSKYTKNSNYESENGMRPTLT